MSAFWAMGALAVLFVIFGWMNRGAAKPSCQGCEHADDPGGCAACPEEPRLKH